MAASTSIFPHEKLQVLTEKFYIISVCRNLPFGGRATRDSRVRLPRKKNARSRHQRLLEENVGKTGKDVVYKL